MFHVPLKASPVAQWLKKKSACRCRKHGFDPRVRNIPWSRKWQPSPIFLRGKLLLGYSHGDAESDTTEHQQQEGSYIQVEAEIWAAKPSPSAWSCSSRWGRGRLGGPGVSQAWSRLHP